MDEKQDSHQTVLAESTQIKQMWLRSSLYWQNTAQQRISNTWTTCIHSSRLLAPQIQIHSPFYLKIKRNCRYCERDKNT